MVALILNSGLGSRMGTYTNDHPKCMTELMHGETILSRQLCILEKFGIKSVIITTGYYNDILMNYCLSLGLELDYKFIYNPRYAETNYIYSIYCARDYLIDQDILMLHGDLVFEGSVIHDILKYEKSCMKVSSSTPLPEKDFKAVIRENRVEKVGVEYFTNALEAQALYKLLRKDWNIWLKQICVLCETNQTDCYAERALNEISDQCEIYAYDVLDRLCTEIDTPDDLEKVLKVLNS